MAGMLRESSLEEKETQTKPRAASRMGGFRADHDFGAIRRAAMFLQL
jgi:hypothetical protein